MEEEEIEKAVIAYLKRKGFRQTELALQEEQSKNLSTPKTDPDIAKQILSFSEVESVPARYREGYSTLRSWTYNSLDLYKHELLRVLYPVFIHCYMDLVAKGYSQEARNFFNSFREDHELVHLRDLQKLEGILSPSHLEENEFARSLRHNKVNIRICQYSYDLLLQYLQKSESMIMLGIINERINFRVSPGQPGSFTDDADVVSLMGSSNDIAKQVNQKEVHWGKRSAEGGKSGTLAKKVKKDKIVGATGKSIRSEASTVSVAPRVKSELALPVRSTEVEQALLEDLRYRAALGSSALPSVSFYTFINTHNSLNCSAISSDGSLVAGGFSDSSLKVWDISKQDNAEGDVESAHSEASAGLEGKRPYTLFQGHAGPIYSAAFSPLGDFILTASADSTVRLWSTKLKANLVCYKGHNYPVWDVQFSPVGQYFASSSHDRTARIWSMDRIQPLRIMAGHLSDVDCVQWHANCNYIATGSSDKTVRLWDVQSGECVRMFIGHRSMVLSMAMSPDGRYMASGDEDGMIMMWDLSTGRCVTPLMGHSSCVWTLAFSCEGSLLASGSADCTVKLWDVTASTKIPKAEEKGNSASRLRSLKTLPTKATPVYALRFSRRNLLFAAGVLSK
ncbi:Transcription initiation factor TFIID subunit 5 [Nymphaea thermarum]|nr:Transcription initiation factor TFIID subunit 5 [Nymphaea thermarum]